MKFIPLTTKNYDGMDLSEQSPVCIVSIELNILKNTCYGIYGKPAVYRYLP